PKLTVTQAQTNGVVLRAVGLVQAIADSAARQLTGRGSPRPADDLRALRRLKDLMDLTDPKTGLASTIRDSSPNGVRVARSVQDSIGSRFAIAATRVLRDSLLPDDASKQLRQVLGTLLAMRLLEPAQNR